MDALLAKIQSKETPIGVVGLGYVGLPLACLLATKFKVVGFDINARRVAELRDGIDVTKEVTDRNRLVQDSLYYTTAPQELEQCKVIIVAVPTPINSYKQPDLFPVISASQTVGKVLKPGTIVCFESTVYPGLTETVCKTELEKASDMTYGKDFFLGYSPERVNPGDKLHTIEKIIKVVSGCNPAVTKVLSNIYGAVIEAGIHVAPNIATAEAAKVIENTQRDLNIALINELSIIFERMGLDTQDVLAAAKTKWNFLDFKPGLVGGHCIGVDPYYLISCAEGLGLHPQVIGAGRRINDNMAKFVGEKTLRMILDNNQNASKQIDVTILGVTFKENVPDLRNTKVVDVADYLESFGVKVHLVDPVADPAEFKHEYNRTLIKWEDAPKSDAIIVAVGHEEVKKQFTLDVLASKLNGNNVLVDLKGLYDKSKISADKFNYWRL